LTATTQVPTISDLRRDYPNVVSAEIIALMLGKDAQRVRNLAKVGKLPFAVVEVGRHRSNYTFPTERYIAWLEGRLQTDVTV
jgi:hypothetical protein